ncbi:hypothetical protein MKP08_06750 [Erythrobacter sp. LQ02-29]|uniref:hypothetical protein n=1 Tax=Erythrobacter sp. LQ02-29 TaxID=2920384 RepID=UPI001F4E231D|nr:hypothetical protein [Erythrobacter sp. LQ02-29]MCP9222441.1 hypothetical protein [Erythrobacter sp. LQ02-29]
MAAAPVPIIPLNLAARNAAGSRWSLDSWLFVRERAAELTSAGTTPANYGASQAGAVLRYRLAPGSSLDPAAYVRVARALGSTHETEGAAGLSAVPVASIPIRLHGEVRLRHDRAGSTIAPSAFLTTELPPVPLPGRFRLESYGQAGYVGGRYATGFADGQARIDRVVGTVGPLELRAGAGTWAGAQKGAARVDIGPTASTRIALGPASARLSVDYRIRVAGNAAPGSGVAVTLSAGF